MNPVDEHEIEILEIVGLDDDEKPAKKPEPPAPPRDEPLRGAGQLRRPSAAGVQVGRIRAAATRDATLAVLRDLLEPLDALEACVRNELDEQGLRQAVRMALRDLWDVFRQHDLERIEGNGVEFDPAIHDAVEIVPTDRVPQGTVLKVLRVGYRLGGELVRPAMVRVAGPDRRGSAGGREETR
ncbi:MAG: hypothetical protein Kow0062_14680 [Acidobacteriota bacterium]